MHIPLKRALFLSEPPPNRLQISEASRLVALRTTALANAVNTRQPRTKILTASLRMRKTARLFRQFNSTASRCFTIRPFCSGCSTVARIGCRVFSSAIASAFLCAELQNEPDAHSRESSLSLRVCPAMVRRSSHEFSSGLPHRNRTYLPNRK
jgi:hypothetical protein